MLYWYCSAWPHGALILQEAPPVQPHGRPLYTSQSQKSEPCPLPRSGSRTSIVSKQQAAREAQQQGELLAREAGPLSSRRTGVAASRHHSPLYLLDADSR